jgi:hypothetical protein
MQMGARASTVPVLVVRSDGSLGVRMGERTTIPGLFVVVDCPACAEPVAAARHQHRRWRVQTIFAYLVGDLSLTRRRDAHAAAAALGALALDWTDARLAVDHDAEAQALGREALARWGLTRAAA